MKVKVFIQLLVIGSWLSMVDSSEGVQGTIVALPMLSGVDSSAHCREANSSGEFISGVVVSSQNHNAIVYSQLYVYSPGCEDNCASCYFKILHSDIEHYMHTLDFNACFTDRGCASWLTLCEQRVYGINFQIDDPTFSAVSVVFTPNFKQCFAVYPLPMHQELPQNSPPSYVYHIIHSTHQRRTAKLRGFSIQNPYDVDSVLSINLTSRAVGLDNGETLTPVGGALNLKCREVMWVEPDLNGTEFETAALSLSGSVLLSSTPLNVFTNSAMLKGTGPAQGFEYDSQLVHQMPERRQWGKHFIVNPGNFEALPEEINPCLTHEITIVSYTAKNKILLRSSSLTAELGTTTRVMSGEHYEYTVYYTQAEMVAMAYLEIVSPSPIVVLHTAYADPEPPSCRDSSVYYSTLVQPVEWHANKQLAVLVHPKKSTTYRYLISIAVPSRESDPANILESKQGEHCLGVPVSNFHTSQRRAGGNYTLLTYKRSIVNSAETETKLLLRHSNANTRIGVTVYAYAADVQYSYSNGYALGGDSTDNDTVCLQTTKTNPSYAVVVGLITMTVIIAALAVFGAVMVKKCRKKRINNRYDRLFAPVSDNDNYQYDIFILCADEDEWFVTDFIEGPLNELGYKTMRKNTAPDGLFAPGNPIMSDIDQVAKLCSQVIVVCSANYSTTMSDNRDHCNIELNYCKELLSGRVIPVILDGGGANDFTEFTQHRVRTADISSNTKARIFIRKLERDICIRRT